MFWLAAFGMVYVVILAAFVIGAFENRSKLRAAAQLARRERQK